MDEMRAARVSAPSVQNRIEPYPRRVRVVFNDVTVADSANTLLLRESGYPPVYYFPPADVRVDRLERTEHHSYCPFRGNASYWTLRVGSRSVENGVWSYEEPFAEARELAGYLAFASDEMDAWYEEDHRALVPGGDPDAITHNPLVRWVIEDAPGAATTRDLVRQLIDGLAEADMPVWRLWLAIRTMHPQLFSVSYRWVEGGPGVEKQLIGHGILQSSGFLSSPLVPIFEGAGGVRRRLEGPDPILDYPIVRDYHAEGATDYVAMPLLFSDGQINAISLATRRPGGFTSGNLGHLYEILPLLSRLLEVHAMRRNAGSLLETYLGRHSGERVLNGRIKRGDAEKIDAVIWFCDLRDSTPLADSMSRDDFLGLLNKFYDCVAQPILENGGEILRFIGDAALAIFPIAPPSDGDGGRTAAEACGQALKAARSARAAVAAENRVRAERDRLPIEFGIALHVGDLTYGNIGTAERLEFTVIGAAANEAARIEGMCKTLGESILVSGDFVSHCDGDFIPLGPHRLRGVNRPQELFALAES